MIRFINRLTHSEMWVADERKDEYLAAGHKLAVCAKTKQSVKGSEDKKPDNANAAPKVAANKPVPSVNRKAVGKSAKKSKTSGKK